MKRYLVWGEKTQTNLYELTNYNKNFFLSYSEENGVVPIQLKLCKAPNAGLKANSGCWKMMLNPSEGKWKWLELLRTQMT